MQSRSTLLELGRALRYGKGRSALISAANAKSSLARFISDEQSLAKVSSSSIFRLLFSWFRSSSACESAVQQLWKSTNLRLLPVTDDEAQMLSLILVKGVFRVKTTQHFSSWEINEATACASQMLLCSFRRKGGERAKDTLIIRNTEMWWCRKCCQMFLNSLMF